MLNESLSCPHFPPWVIIPSKNDTSVFINDVVIVTVNSPLSLWAFTANLALIIAVVKTPTLRFRSNVLLCGLATADCLTGLIAQPSFICWRMALHYVDCQNLMAFFLVEEISFFAIIVTSYVMLIPISCDRLYALARPLQYRAVAKEMKGAILASVAAWVFMLVYSLLIFIAPEIVFFIDPIFAGLVTGVPIACHIAMFICVRRHNQNIQDLNHQSSQQLSASLQREKRIARTMALIIVIPLILIVPNVVVVLVSSPFIVNMLFPWTTTLTMVTSSLNPVIHLLRDKKLRRAVKSLFAMQLCTAPSDVENGDTSMNVRANHRRNGTNAGDDINMNDANINTHYNSHSNNNDHDNNRENNKDNNNDHYNNNSDDYHDSDKNNDDRYDNDDHDHDKSNYDDHDNNSDYQGNDNGDQDINNTNDEGKTYDQDNDKNDQGNKNDRHDNSNGDQENNSDYQNNNINEDNAKDNKNDDQHKNNDDQDNNDEDQDNNNTNKHDSGSDYHDNNNDDRDKENNGHDDYNDHDNDDDQENDDN